MTYILVPPPVFPVSFHRHHLLPTYSIETSNGHLGLLPLHHLYNPSIAKSFQFHPSIIAQIYSHTLLSTTGTLIKTVSILAWPIVAASYPGPGSLYFLQGSQSALYKV